MRIKLIISFCVPLLFLSLGANRFTAVEPLKEVFIRVQQDKEKRKTLPLPRYLPDRNYDLRNVALDLRFDWEAEQTFGTATLTFAPLLAGTRQVTFNAAKMQINSIKFQTGAPLRFSYDEPKDLLTVEFGKTYQPSDVLTIAASAQNTKTVVSPAPSLAVTRKADFDNAATEADSIILVISKNDRTLSFIDPAQMKELAKIPIPGGPHELTVSADNRFAYLANYYQADAKLGHSISVIDVAARKEIRKIETGALEMLHGIVETGGKLYFTSEQTRTVARLDTATDSVDWIRGTGQSLTHIPVISPDGKRLYATNMNSDSVTMIDIEGSGQDAAAIKQIAVGSKPEGIAISPDGKELWVGHNGDGGVSIVDTATLAVKKTFKAGTMPIRLKFTADGKRVVVADPRTSEVIIYDSATAREIKRIAVPGGPVSFAFSPDEKQVAVSLLNIAKMAVVDLENAKVLGTVPIGNVPDGIVWVKKI